MKKIRMTACVLILALAVCVLAGCSNKNNTPAWQMKPPLPPRAHRKVRTEELMARMELWERPQIRQQKTAATCRRAPAW